MLLSLIPVSLLPFTCVYLQEVWRLISFSLIHLSAWRLGQCFAMASELLGNLLEHETIVRWLLLCPRGHPISELKEHRRRWNPFQLTVCGMCGARIVAWLYEVQDSLRSLV